MTRKTSGLAMLAAGAGGAAIAGYGFSIGRDLWKSTKKNSGILLILFALAAAVALPMLGARGIVRGHDRSPVGTLLITMFGNLLLIACGFALSVLLLGFLTNNDTHPHAGFAAAAVLGACWTGLLSLAGLLWGIFERPKRRRTISVAKANAQFLADLGFKETGGDDITHYDPSGQPLRFLEAHENRLVFVAVGKRGKRAFIDLDAHGRMVGYSGVV